MGIIKCWVFKQSESSLCGFERKRQTWPSHHHQVLGDPAVGREVLQHGHQELQATVPMAQQQHHPDQIDDSHHGAGQVVRHVEDLRRGASHGGLGTISGTGLNPDNKAGDFFKANVAPRLLILAPHRKAKSSVRLSPPPTGGCSE